MNSKCADELYNRCVLTQTKKKKKGSSC